jgi:hypothetical protein
VPGIEFRRRLHVAYEQAAAAHDQAARIHEEAAASCDRRSLLALALEHREAAVVDRRFAETDRATSAKYST